MDTTATTNGDRIGRITDAVLARDGRRERDEVRFRCIIDGHEDEHPSARWNDTKKVWRCDVCRAGGGWKDLERRLGLTPERPRRRSAPASRRAAGGRGGVHHPPKGSNPRIDPAEGLTLERYAAAKRLNVANLRQYGLGDVHVGTPAVRIPYYDPEGREIAVRFRCALDGPNRFRWRRGAKPCLYGLERLAAARDARHVVIVEGESDAHTLWHHDVPAVGLPGAATWREAWAPLLEGIATVYVVVEPDQGGAAVERWLAGSALRDRARLVRLDGYKDPSALHLASPDGFGAAWTAALAAAIPWTERAAAEDARAAAAAFAAARPLLERADLLAHIGEQISKTGFAGDVTPALLGYVAITSRLLERPMNLAYIAPSAAGKNRAIDAALPFVPPGAVYVASASSPRALVYTSEHFKHRTVIVKEADSLPDDGPAASAIRSVAEDNLLTYDVVERDTRTGHFETRRIEKPGPTGLITTSTRSLRHQLGTRHLEVSIADDREQTRNVMRAHAATVTGARPGVSLDLTPFVALQQWLATAGARAVVIPFAGALADLVPPHAVRMRRDFRQLLTGVQAVALLHQCQRERTADGAIVATFSDYERARELLAPLFAVLVAEGVTPAVRETVEAVKPEEEITEAKLAERLKVSRSTAHYRVGRALTGGWLINHETRRGAPARLARGAELPPPEAGLPLVAALRQRFDDANESGPGLYPPPPPDGAGAAAPFEGDLA